MKTTILGLVLTYSERREVMRGIAVVAFVLLTVALNAPVVAQQAPVEFADPALKAAVEEALGVPDPTPGAMLRLSSLTVENQGIVSLAGLEYVMNLEILRLRHNQISDVSPLAGLTQLDALYLSGNQISDVSPLAELTRLGLDNG